MTDNSPSPQPEDECHYRHNIEVTHDNYFISNLPIP